MEHKHTKITDLLALLTFLLLALCLLLVLLTGARVYRNLVQAGETAFQSRTALQYAATRIRQARTVTIQDFQGCPALVIPETIDGECYVTRIYCHEGHIRELFSSEEAALSPEDGETVLEGQLHFAFDGELLTLYSGGDSLILQIRTGREVGP